MLLLDVKAKCMVFVAAARGSTLPMLGPLGCEAMLHPSTLFGPGLSSVGPAASVHLLVVTLGGKEPPVLCKD